MALISSSGLFGSSFSSWPEFKSQSLTWPSSSAVATTLFEETASFETSFRGARCGSSPPVS